MTRSHDDAGPAVCLRPVVDSDVETLYRHQADPVANLLADFPAREHAAYLEHIARIRQDPDCLLRAITVADVVVGNIGSFWRDGVREVGYWIDREHWGRGIATAALRAFLDVERARPLHAGVAPGNEPSARVLTRCGFLPDGVDDADGYLLFVLTR